MEARNGTASTFPLFYFSTLAHDSRPLLGNSELCGKMRKLSPWPHIFKADVDEGARLLHKSFYETR